MGDRGQAGGRTGITGDKYQVAFLGATLAPFEIVCRFRRLAILIGTKECDIEVVTREFEIVGVAAEEGCGKFGGEDEPDIRIFLISVEVITPATVEGNDVTAQAGAIERLL